MPLLKLFVSTILTVFILDILWIGVIAKNLYEENIGTLLRKSEGSFSPNWSAAVVVYVAITLGIICFVLPKAEGDYSSALLWGAVFGAVTYGIYDFTNLATLNSWTLHVTLIDVAWGMVLCGVASVVAVYVQNWLSA